MRTAAARPFFLALRAFIPIITGHLTKRAENVLAADHFIGLYTYFPTGPRMDGGLTLVFGIVAH